MPGPIVHQIVQQRLGPFLSDLGGADGKIYANLLEAGECSPYPAFGSQGPDFLFFSLREYGEGISKFSNFVFKVIDAFDPLVEFYEQTIEPVKDQIDNALDTLDQTLFQGLFAEIKETSNLLTTTALNAVAVGLTNNVDLFYPFYPMVQRGKPEKDWYWIDFLHTRRTGNFISNLWQISGNDSDLQRYTLGYASHFTTDVVGHPYVNSLVGGPYRTHWHRHKLIENWIDSYARNLYPDSAATIQCLNLGPEDNYNPNAVSGSYYYRLTEFAEGRLPGKLKRLWVEAMRATYGDLSAEKRPPFLNEGDLDTAYRLWLMFYERITSNSDVERPQPVPPPGSATTALVSDYLDGLPDFPGGSGTPSGGFSLGALFQALLGLASWMIDSLAYTFDWIINHVVDIFLLPYTELLNLMKWLLYQVQKYVWEIYDNLRFAMVLGGYLHPEVRDLQKQPWGLAFLNSDFVSLTGGASASFSKYPNKQESHSLTGPTEHHLTYPVTPLEKQRTEPAPKPFHGKFPEAFISDGYAYDAFIEKLYSCKKPYGPTVNATHYVDKHSWNTGQFGSTLHFGGRLIGHRLQTLPNFNMDGDRGYGWKTWRALDPVNINTVANLKVNYIDI